MRARSDEKKPLTVHAVAGTYVVLLGIDLAEKESEGLLGFAIERWDQTEKERYWLLGMKTFLDTDPGHPAGSAASTRDHPIQGFRWSDFTAKPDHKYTYRVVALKGSPKHLIEYADASVEVTTESESQAGAASIHHIWFNRGVAASQAYSRQFHNLEPDQVPDGKAFTWLSRGLVEALLAFIGRASGKRYALRGALYEFHNTAVLEAFRAASETGADVQIIFDAKHNSKSYPRDLNLAAIKTAGIKALVTPRESNSGYISHNKFIVLLKDKKPIEVWTGSTNISDGGIFGHSNVGHLVRDAGVAKSFLDYWTELRDDPEAKPLREWTEKETKVPDELPVGISCIFSPRKSLEALEWFSKLMDAAKTAVFLTAAFGVNDLFNEVLAEEKGYLRYVILDKDGGDAEIIRRDQDNRVAVGAVLGANALEDWLLREKTTGLNPNVRFIHTKYLLLDPLGDDPIVITGSANFSNPSTKSNDENMLIIRGDQRVADIYLGEFMRLFQHFVFRDFATSKSDEYRHLSADDSWSKPYYQEGHPKQKERLYFR